MGKPGRPTRAIGRISLLEQRHYGECPGGDANNHTAGYWSGPLLTITARSDTVTIAPLCNLVPSGMWLEFARRNLQRCEAI
jgi:hypothetical protein